MCIQCVRKKSSLTVSHVKSSNLSITWNSVMTFGRTKKNHFSVLTAQVLLTRETHIWLGYKTSATKHHIRNIKLNLMPRYINNYYLLFSFLTAAMLGLPDPAVLSLNVWELLTLVADNNEKQNTEFYAWVCAERYEEEDKGSVDHKTTLACIRNIISSSPAKNVISRCMNVF